MGQPCKNCFKLLNFEEDIWAVLRPWNYHIELDIGSSITIHQQLLNHFQMLMREGSWLSGSALPSTRDLAKNLGINRKTVAKVYDELSAQGWIYTEPKRGTFVADSLPNVSTEPITTTKTHTTIETQPPSEHALKIAQLLQKEMVKLTRRVALHMHKTAYARIGVDRTTIDKKENETIDAGGLKSLRALIAQLLIHELRLNTHPANVLCHHNGQILYQALITQLKARGDYLLIDEDCPIQDKNTLRDHGFILLEVPSQEEEVQATSIATNLSLKSMIFAHKNPSDNITTRTLSLEVIEKYCINYPVAALWLSTNAENVLGQTLAVSSLVKTRLQQFNVLLVEDHRQHFISSKHNISGKYLTDNTIILGSLYAHRHPYVDIHYLALPHSLTIQAYQYLNAYVEPQSLLNAQIQYEFIKGGHYKKLSLAWESLFEERYKKISDLFQAHAINSNYRNTKDTLLKLKSISKQAIYFNHSKSNKHGMLASLENLAIHLDEMHIENIKIEYVNNHTSRLNYQQLDEATFIKLYAGLKNVQKNAYVPKEFLLKAG